MQTIKRIKKGDQVKVIAGGHKGTVAVVAAVLPRMSGVLLAGVNVSSRRIKPNRLHPQGGTRDIHSQIHISNVALVIDDKKQTTSRVGYRRSAEGKLIRVARRNNKELT